MTIAIQIQLLMYHIIFVIDNERKERYNDIHIHINKYLKVHQEILANLEWYKDNERNYRWHEKDKPYFIFLYPLVIKSNRHIKKHGSAFWCNLLYPASLRRLFI